MTTENLEKPITTAPTGRDDASAPSAEGLPVSAEQHKARRTLGLKIFDNFLYTFFTNTTVFLVSLGFTYMTKYGKTVGAEKSALRGVGTWFAERRQPIMNWLKKIGLKSEEARENLTTVIFSFVDGTIFSFLVKPLEDRREKIAQKIDNALGTTPENMKVYEAEPKQSWRSVVEGRALTSMIVLPVALIMEKTGGNRAIFYRNGDKLANFVKNSVPKLDNWLSKKTIHHKDYFFQTGVFEAFYTSVCTLGLYAISRTIARKHPKNDRHAIADAPVRGDASTADTTNREEVPATRADPLTPEKPLHHISRPTEHERVVERESMAEVTA